MKKPKKQFSLKIRIFVFFFGILLLMLCTYIFAISRFITRFTERQLNSDYEAILTETSDTIETLLWNLTLTSEQLLSNETIRTCILGYQNTDNPYVKLENWSCISETILSLTMDNTDIALTYIYDPSTEEYIYSTLPADAENEEIPVIYENSAFCFQGPCNSQSKFIGNPVLILNRTEILESENPILLSVESGYYSLDGPLEQAARKSAYIAITNYLGELIYHTFPETIDASEILTRISDGSDPEYRFFSDTSSQGWSVHVVIPSSIYTRDYQSAIRDFAVCSILIALLVACFAMYFWKSIYQPLQLFDRQFDILLSDDIPEEQMHSSIPEYDRLLKRIVVLQAQIREMIGRIIEQEKLNTKIQLEKLRAQINPHFLMNTLNTIHWMSLMNGQKDIDRITQSLSHLLSYNLDKESYITSLKGEISALSEYVTLQKVRYEFDFLIHCRQEVEQLNYPCPKFILQPLVENALSHGYREGMTISLSVFVDDYITIQISDTGTGMDAETLLMLRSLPETAVSDSTSALPVSDSVHFGIGLQYVVQMLNDFYSGDYGWEIESTPCEGTSITLKIPKLKGGGYCA